jgi:glucokinase
MKPKWAIGLDFGGTNARMALVDSGARILDSIRTDSRQVATPALFVKWAAGEAAGLLKRNQITRAQCAGIGIGVPGPVDSRKGVILVLPNLPRWKNIALEGLLARQSGLRAVMDNDGNAMTLGEHRFGAARRTRHALFITMGTGIGCGIIYDGKLFHGASFSAAEISHMRHGGSSVACGCGSRGCIETRMGHRSLRDRAERELKPFSAALREQIDGTPDKKLRLEHVTVAAKAGDRRAIRFWSGVAEEFGDFLGGICNLLNPEMIVIGGGVAGAGKYLLEPLRKSVQRHAFALATDRLRIVPAKFGSDAGLIGAAALAFTRAEERT